jgi:hypothetical protein
LVQRLKALTLGSDYAFESRGTATRLWLAQARPARGFLATQAPVTGSKRDPLHNLAFVLGQRAVIVSHSRADPVIGEMNLLA